MQSFLKVTIFPFVTAVNYIFWQIMPCQHRPDQLKTLSKKQILYLYNLQQNQGQDFEDNQSVDYGLCMFWTRVV